MIVLKIIGLLGLALILAYIWLMLWFGAIMAQNRPVYYIGFIPLIIALFCVYKAFKIVIDELKQKNKKKSKNK